MNILNVHPTSPENPQGRVNRFMHRYISCRGALAMKEIMSTDADPRECDVREVAATSPIREQQVMHAPLASTSQAMTTSSDGSFLSLFMQAFAAARQPMTTNVSQETPHSMAA
ncbi:hypothetical protein [Oleiagrimonas sp.]|jgi:hypothetical protein|uniref:hypothetical protein n=1 Tax=Oleiagrimonas sp. TaxID=2010330 RepID=UPI002623F976|nr:hypothetical protein [Oleiagrimonas sp.]MDA3913978.1 hypothetical protein [Oleiagrimonas sp.]